MKYKVGDRVRLIKRTGCVIDFGIGDICTITDTHCGGWLKIEIECDGHLGYVAEEHIEKVEENKMNKREIEERIKKAQAELEEAKKMLENYKEEEENWKPEMRRRILVRRRGYGDM